MSQAHTYPAPSKSPTKNAQGAGNFVNFVFLQCTKNKYAETLRRVQIEITSPLRVFSWRFRERWVKRCIRHATAKFGSLVHRFGMISVGLHARECFEIDFWSFWTPKSGVFCGGHRHFFKNLKRQSSKKSPIFPRTKRVLAESSATFRESCSTEMKRI